MKHILQCRNPFRLVTLGKVGATIAGAWMAYSSTLSAQDSLPPIVRESRSPIQIVTAEELEDLPPIVSSHSVHRKKDGGAISTAQSGLNELPPIERVSMPNPLKTPVAVQGATTPLAPGTSSTPPAQAIGSKSQITSSPNRIPNQVPAQIPLPAHYSTPPYQQNYSLSNYTKGGDNEYIAPGNWYAPATSPPSYLDQGKTKVLAVSQVKAGLGSLTPPPSIGLTPAPVAAPTSLAPIALEPQLIQQMTSAEGSVSGGYCESCGSSNCREGSFYYGPDDGCCYGSYYPIKRYLIADALYFDRADGSMTGSQNFILDDYNYRPGGRITLGQRFDCFEGYEITYTGQFRWLERGVLQQPAGGLRSIFVPGGSFGPNALSAFNSSIYQEQSHETTLDSLEFNRSMWAWDVMSFTFGLRYIQVNDQYLMKSINTSGDVGQYFQDIRNQLIGLQIGDQIYYDIGARLSFSLRGKIGAFANFNHGFTAISNKGSLLVNNTSNDVDFSALFETGALLHYSLGPRIRLRGGYELWAITNLATANKNVTPLITPATGTSLTANDDVIFHGAVAGLEVFW